LTPLSYGLHDFCTSLGNYRNKAMKI